MINTRLHLVYHTTRLWRPQSSATTAGLDDDVTESDHPPGNPASAPQPWGSQASGHTGSGGTSGSSSGEEEEAPAEQTDDEVASESGEEEKEDSPAGDSGAVSQVRGEAEV